MADEYQDTNGVQARITLLLGGEKNNIMVVGDDAQSIYSFRGARVSNIINFPESFAGCRVIRLERNCQQHCRHSRRSQQSNGKRRRGFQEASVYRKGQRRTAGAG